jgi:hypothetical protein
MSKGGAFTPGLRQSHPWWGAPPPQDPHPRPLSRPTKPPSPGEGSHHPSPFCNSPLSRGGWLGGAGEGGQGGEGKPFRHGTLPETLATFACESLLQSIFRFAISFLTAVAFCIT